VLYPDAGITKRDVARYYAQVAPFMLPHVARRPLTLVRCPEGIAGACFYQKHPGRGSSPALHAVSIRESKGARDYVTVLDVAGLVSLVQLGALEIHAWGARAPDVEHPDLVTFDLDPDPGVAWSRTVAAARELRERLAQLGLQSFAKTTGGKGLHVVVPLAPLAGWDAVKAFSRALVNEMVRDAPEEYLAKASKAARRGKIFLDYLRNARSATAICPYSTRARPGAPVATPISWSELDAKLDPRRFDLRSVPKRLARLSRDPWQGYTELRQELPAPR
jgi:bifunctional non-homologous end joining protein LigD